MSEEKIQKVLRKAILERKLIRFYYESESSGKKEWRVVEPYIVGIKETGNKFLAALPITELSKPLDKRVTGHYLLKKMDLKKLELLDETFDEPHVRRKRIVDTPTIKVICRFIYSDE